MNRTRFGARSVDQTSPIPAARSMVHFQIAEIGNGEVVLLDTERLTYHTLNRPAFAVWRLCDGNRTLFDLNRALRLSGAPLSLEAIELAILELTEAGLLEEAPGSVTGHLSRRRMLKLAAAGLAGGALVPAVSSITAPVAAETASECFPSIVCSIFDGTCEPFCQSRGFLFGVCNVFADGNGSNGGCCDCFDEFPGG